MSIINCTRDMCYLFAWTSKNKQFLTCDTLCNDIIRDTLNCMSAWGNKNDIMSLFFTWSICNNKYEILRFYTIFDEIRLEFWWQRRGNCNVCFMCITNNIGVK